MDTLVEFINSSKLANIEIGVSREFVENLLGEPTDEVALSDDLVLWSYGYGLEVYADSFVKKIAVKYDYMSESFSLPEYFRVKDGSVFSRCSSIDKIIRILEENEIGWEIGKTQSDDTTICLICNERTLIYYSLSDHHILSIQSYDNPYLR